MGRLKASQKWTKRAPFCDAGMSSVPGQDPGLVGHHADGHAAHAGQRRHEVRRPPGPQLEDARRRRRWRARRRARRRRPMRPPGPGRAAPAVARSGGRRCASGGARRRCGRGDSRAPPRAARPRRRRRRPAARTIRSLRACMAAPPRSCRLTRIPVNPSTASGPDTKAKASGVITVTSARPSSSAGPEIAAPVTAARTGTDPEHAAMAAAARPQPCRASMPSETSDPDDDRTTTRGRRSASATPRRLGDGVAVGLGERAAVVPRHRARRRRRCARRGSPPRRVPSPGRGCAGGPGTRTRTPRLQMREPGTPEPAETVATGAHVRRTAAAGRCSRLGPGGCVTICPTGAKGWWRCVRV